MLAPFLLTRSHAHLVLSIELNACTSQTLPGPKHAPFHENWACIHSLFECRKITRFIKFRIASDVTSNDPSSWPVHVRLRSFNNVKEWVVHCLLVHFVFDYTTLLNHRSSNARSVVQSRTERVSPCDGTFSHIQCALRSSGRLRIVQYL